jgi:hypothetical protein
VDAAVCDDFGAIVHQGKHNEVAATRVDLLTRAQRFVDDQHRGRRQLHLANQLGEHDRLGLAGDGARHVGRLGQASSGGRRHLLGVAAAHGHRQQAMAAQQGDQRTKVDRLTNFAHAPQVDGHRVVVEQVRRHRHTLGQLLREHGKVGGLEHHRHQRQRGAAQF